MRFPIRFRSRHRTSLLLVLTLLGLVLVPQSVHAGSPFVNEVHIQDCASSGCSTTSSFTATSGNTLVADCFQLTNSACTISDSLSSSWTLRMSQNSGGNIAQSLWTTTLSSSGSDTVTFTFPGGTDRIEAQVVQYTGITGIGTNGIDNSQNNPATFSSTITITTSAPSVIYEGWDVHNGATGTCASLSSGNALTSFNCDTSTANAKNSLSAQTILASGAGTFPVTVSWTGGTAGNNFQVHFAIELDLPPAAVSTTSTQCYGNCGSPAITLANTNSTHTTNFNQSITLLYEFQSNLNGFLLNVTTSLAKSYANTGNGPILGIYTVSSCPTGQTPFSPQCPGQLQQSQSFVGSAKGKVSFSGLKIPVINGQWVGIALSAFNSGLDVNDTNTNLQIFQTNEGKIPAVIQAPSSLPNSKIGLWAWINGNAISTGPSPPIGGLCTNNFAQLDCMIPAMVNGLCSIVTVSCQTSASLFWIFALTILSFMLVTVGFASAHITKFIAAGDVFVFFFLGWFFIFVGVGVIASFVTIFILFAGAIVFGRNARAYF